MTITQIIHSVARTLPAEACNDLPMIRQALNDSVDHAVRDGSMTESRANNWNQDNAVKRVRGMLKFRFAMDSDDRSTHFEE